MYDVYRLRCIAIPLQLETPPTLGMEFLGMGHGEEVTNALCPKWRGGCPSPPTLEMEFPAAFN
ncbi:MAG: hypothetical protein V7K67_21595 [Nostoc sp.]|uniref:hypothetical protein n=1 Tax=Nostoc sp. TaxID=1180 RepID=UPI002FFAB709